MRIWFLFKEKYGLYSICYYYICENEKNVVTLQNLFKRWPSQCWRDILLNEQKAVYKALIIKK